MAVAIGKDKDVIEVQEWLNTTTVGAVWLGSKPFQVDYELTSLRAGQGNRSE